MNYNEMTDEKLVELYKSGETIAFDELYVRYKYVIVAASRSFYLSGGDKDDLLQEGFLGLLKAVDTYNGKSSFKSYVYLCIRSKMITAIKKSLSGKNRPMCGYVSLYGQSTELSRLFAAGPEEKIIDEENASEFMEKVRSKLSKFEIIVLNYYLDGLTYTEISKKLGKEPKCIDNALQRIKKKISQIYVCD